MAITTVASLKTELTDRELWYDGESTLSEEGIRQLILCGESTVGMCVAEETPHIIQYNNLVSKEEELHIKEGIKPLTYDWIIPDEYKDIDVDNYVIQKLLDTTEATEHAEFSARTGRVLDELDLYKKLELMDVLRTLIFVINTLIENNVVWGVGRGSSVSSYVLYLMGVHDVDSFKYGLNIEEFLRTE